MNKYLNYNFLIHFGLGTIFIANALAAFFAPLEHFGLLFMSMALALGDRYLIKNA